MKPNSENVLFEGTVMFSHVSHTTEPPSEVIDVNYELPPMPVYDLVYNENTGMCDEKLVYLDDKGWTQITLPKYNGLKTGDKIKIIKV
jgi:hypothetical protein